MLTLEAQTFSATMPETDVENYTMWQNSQVRRRESLGMLGMLNLYAEDVHQNLRTPGVSSACFGGAINKIPMETEKLQK